MEQLNISLALAGAVIVLIGLFSNYIKRSLLQEPIIAVLAGIAAGPYGFDWNTRSDTSTRRSRSFTLPMFVIFGIALPFSEWARLGWPLLALTVLVLLLRRPPVIAMIFPGIRGTLDARDS